MLTVLFFASVFSSLTWLVYMFLYIRNVLGGNDLSSLSVETLALYAGLLCVPLWVVWQIFGYVNQYFRNKAADTRLTQLFNQMKKNQDYTDLVVRVMLDAEHEIKDGFVVNKFDIFIADMNEILADIVQRCNAASSLQMEQLWARVKNGERWTIAKTLVEAAKTHHDFSLYLTEKAQKDSVFKGTLLEFCARYQNLNALLEKHDRDRVFITIIETGVMGKVYSILAPAADAVAYVPEAEVQTVSEEAPDVSQKILDMEEPKSDEEPSSFFSRLNPFKPKKIIESEAADEAENNDDAFFSALQKSMNSPEETHKTYRQETENVSQHQEPRFSFHAEPAVVEPLSDMAVSQEDEEAAEEEISELYIKPEDVPEEKLHKSENFAYPFGGWMNEENYKK